MLGLRTCDENMKSHNGFTWPKSGWVKADDWDPSPYKAGGLHFLPWGEGNGNLLDWEENAKWIVIEVDENLVVNIDNQKAKAEEVKVVYCGNQEDATQYIKNVSPSRAVAGARMVVGDRSTATTGYRGIAVAGDKGIATAGHSGVAVAGYDGAAFAGNRGIASAGEKGIATVGHSGIAIAGDRGTALGDEKSTVISGKKGTLIIKKWDDELHRYRVVVAYVGEGDIKPNIKYKLDDKGEFVLSEENSNV